MAGRRPAAVSQASLIRCALSGVASPIRASRVGAGDVEVAQDGVAQAGGGGDVGEHPLAIIFEAP